MSTNEQVRAADEDDSTATFSQCYEQAFAPSAFAFDGGMETN